MNRYSLIELVIDAMRLSIFTAFVLTVIALGPRTECLAETVSCEVKEVSGSILILENCDERLAKDFQKGDKVKVRLQKKEK